MYEINDKIVVKVSKENREWGYNPCPDGILGTIVEFGTIFHTRINAGCCGLTPGIYENPSSLRVQLETGELIWLSKYHVKPANGVDNNNYAIEKRLADLPETKFYEEDLVLFEGKVTQIHRINYDNIGMFCNDGVTPMPLYGLLNGYSCSDSKLELVERGNYWKYYHDEKPFFSSIKEEACFYYTLGKAKQVKNKQDWRFTPEQALQAIRDRVADGMDISGGFSEGALYKFDNEEVGSRVAKYTLKNLLLGVQHGV